MTTQIVSDGMVLETEALDGRLSDYVTAYAGDLSDRALDGQYVVVGGIVIYVETDRGGPDYVILRDLHGPLVVLDDGAIHMHRPQWEVGRLVVVGGSVDTLGPCVRARRVVWWGDAKDMDAGDFQYAINIIGRSDMCPTCGQSSTFAERLAHIRELRRGEEP